MVGQRLGGRYQLEERIGGGGMAIVYKAKDLLLHRPVAVKVLRPQFGTDEDFVNRFRREAQAVASLSHPNVVSVYDVGQDEDTHYMVMEYIEGPTLKDVINQIGALPVEEAVRIAVQVCDALDHAHQNKIIHRDIKPHNILIGKNGRVKVTDFGIARAVTAATITHTNSVMGSVHYFSPEQARGGVTAEKSDIYSLGIVLYEMVTGQLPFSGDSPITVALKHLQDPLTDPRQINPSIPQSVENIILKALAKDPFLRYASARDMLSDLETCLSPERRNEPKIQFPVDDEMTRVIPAITEEMLEQAQWEKEGIRRTQGESDDEEESSGRKRWWWKAAAWVGAIGLFFVLALFGMNLVQGIFDVPEVNVPHVEGAPVENAIAMLKEKNLVPQVEEEYSNTVAKGLVISQDPAPPMRVKENATVKLVVSLGKQSIKMPDLKNQNRSVAETTLKQYGFTVDDNTFIEQENDDVPAGVVISQDPPAEQPVVPSETDVKVYISKGKQFVDMPNLVGDTLEEAKVKLYQRGLTVGKVSREPTYMTEEKDIVISTFPFEPNMKVQSGAAIDLTVSSGSYPADAKFAAAPITINLIPGETAKIRFVVDDARGETQLPEETLTESKEYQVPVVLSPTKNAKVTVYKDGNKVQTYSIDYNSLP
ncbi:Stk1 family PASTA domain-containing Ser/Thr kinase [Brevibacillus sp. SYP-B805]|uniref:Stk1 family PASTA domain-containing Ser/Thr kinase n=1 Tax=Brevibacillus sp. SYP-B805 TaxID=1578199 RepID=UPI0013EDA5A2|nr:Stk1 family PASTA domain-containing Ser/Thr kinase [Brevibacillus sp. SYP-B805]NGQ93818.1 Stk1 family PASTA domain-containing Ser/Thr kinase [Brevibacillus sp. SYP-B805]